MKLHSTVICLAAASVVFSAEPTPDPLELKGTQIHKTLTLERASRPHLVTGDYAIPEGAELIIKPGTEISFNKDSGLTVSGNLLVKGTEEDPVILAGKATGTGYWHGINRSPVTEINHARIKGAENGISINASKPTIQNTILYRNVVGIHVGGYGSESHPQLKNCLIIENKSDGIVLTGSKLDMERCTICRNGGWGIRGSYYASPTIAWTRIVQNKKGGIWCQLYNCRAKAHNSVILKNGKYDVFNDSPAPWDFSGNWWGKAATQLLQKKGDTAEIQAIRDGRDDDTSNRGEVSLFNFLKREPEDCGSTLDLRVHWK